MKIYNTKSFLRALFLGVSLLSILTACGGGGGNSGGNTPDPANYTIGGTVTGLTGSVELQNNGGDNLSVSTNGGFTFASALDHKLSGHLDRT